jgi:hypothetical protein
MNGEKAALIEMLFGFGVVLAWALWELWSLDRDKRRAAKNPSARPQVERARDSEGQHGADDGGSQTPQ